MRKVQSHIVAIGIFSIFISAGASTAQIQLDATQVTCGFLAVMNECRAVAEDAKARCFESTLAGIEGWLGIPIRGVLDEKAVPFIDQNKPSQRSQDYAEICKSRLNRIR